jgi:hypothetical protein
MPMPAADLVDIKKFRAAAKRSKRPRRQPVPTMPDWPLPFAAESALRSLRLAQEDLPPKSREHLLITHAVRDLERGLATNTKRARRDLRETLVRALGPDLTVGDIEGARRALKLLLALLPPTPD